ncbi:hypothetical protein [Pseudomonas chlororaphis]|uniref:hypothetical protein n=1 Tax=Pseudomonas chlororaphis TaxID=587753 RepID=UPI003C1C3491
MIIDKEKLKSLLWSVVASWKADDGDLLRHADALEELLGDKTVEEVALLLIKENERLEVERDGSKVLLKDVISRESQLTAENEALRKALGNLLLLYVDDEGCQLLPEYIAGRAAMSKGEQP